MVDQRDHQFPLWTAVAHYCQRRWSASRIAGSARITCAPGKTILAPSANGSIPAASRNRRASSSETAASETLRTSYQDWDITASKGIFFGESKQLRFQASFFNAFNHVNLGQPDTGVNDSTFGVISSDFQPRYGQLGMTFTF